MKTRQKIEPELVRSLSWNGNGRQSLSWKEWLVTNGLGGYAGGTVCGGLTRRYHGLLIAALPTPFGRVVMLNYVMEQLRFPDGRIVPIAAVNRTDAGEEFNASQHLAAFRLEEGLPVWTFDIAGIQIEKRLLMPNHQNTTHIGYRMLSEHSVRLELRPLFAIRLHERPVSHPAKTPYPLQVTGDKFEVHPGENLPPVKMYLHHEGEKAFTVQPAEFTNVLYELEQHRGYACWGTLWNPGYFRLQLSRAHPGTLVASTESWETIGALTPEQAAQAEHLRRHRLLEFAREVPKQGPAAELVLAADQFIITPAGRIEEAARARASGDEVRTVVAGYPWFTDWGRDTMISLEGLTLCTGREREAGYILRTFGRYIQDGLIPNMFPEGTSEGLYHTADASLWFFHALHRYVERTGDHATLRLLLPKFRSIIDHHVKGTRFGIGVDPADGLLRQGAPGYQLTWMDAKVEDWVVTPRRGKAVEINALWYNALRIFGDWLREEGDADVARIDELAEQARESFNSRFWYEEGGYLYDVIDGELGDDPACRPNQIFSISLDHPVLQREYWEPVFNVVRDNLLTPVGLRTLAPGHRDYKAQYYGDLRSRDAAYHQGTVWGWLAAPFVDVWLKLHPDDRAGARKVLEGFVGHLDEGAVGSLSEIFDAEQPYSPRGCVAQAWSVAEVLRAWIKTGEEPKSQDQESRIKNPESGTRQA